MNDPTRENCKVCGKSLKKTSMKRHLDNVHGPGAANKKSVKADRELAKKKALQKASKELFTNKEYNKDIDDDANKLNTNNYSVPPDMTDADLDRMTQMLEEFELIDDPAVLSFDSSAQEPKTPPRKPNVSTPNAPRKREQPELAIQRRLEKQYGGGHKVIPLGIIDILTKDSLIEIKCWDDFLKGFGQLIAYGEYYPKHMKHIHFFGQPPSADKEVVIRTLFAKHAIKVTQEPWP